MPHIDAKTWKQLLALEKTELHPPATAKALAAFEKKQKLALPEAHREFLLRHNGGVLGYVYLFGVACKPSGLDFARQLAQILDFVQETADHPVLPFASDAGGNYFCYDLSKPAKATGYPVLFWCHEYSEESDDRDMLWHKHGKDFVDFLKKVAKG